MNKNYFETPLTPKIQANRKYILLRKYCKMSTSNIIDKPRAAGADDLLGIDKYTNALIEFINTCEMPTTLAIQGEWGSGKTSLLNQVKYCLCEDEVYSNEINKEKAYYGIWVNTWQYSLMKTKEETMIAIIRGLTFEILKVLKRKHETKTQATLNKVGSILGKITTAGTKAAVKSLGINGDSLIDSIVSSGDESGGTLLTFKKSLEEAVNKCLDEDKSAGNNNRGFIFFIDDLDRIDPPMAVEILELIKNIFEVGHCIFILAIDYEVVVKGLIPKFGPLTEKNEREFRSFFDKIIQLPFSMPVSTYNVSEFLLNSLKQIGYIQDNTNNDELKESLAELAILSVGTNPHSLKRLINTLSFLRIIRNFDKESSNQQDHEILLNFALVCVQVAFPSLYSFLLQEPNFKSWNEQTAKKVRLPEISEAQAAIIESTDEFNEEWETILFRKCQQDSYLSTKVFSISQFFNMMIDYVPDKLDFGDEVSRVLGFSAVTSLNSDISPKITQKFTKVRYSSWDDFVTEFSVKFKSSTYLDLLKKVHDDILNDYGPLAKVNYGTGTLTFDVVMSSSQKRCFVYIILSKKKFSFWKSLSSGRLPINNIDDYYNFKSEINTYFNQLSSEKKSELPNS